MGCRVYSLLVRRNNHYFTIRVLTAICMGHQVQGQDICHVRIPMPILHHKTTRVVHLHLPRHVSLVNTRYAFHVESRQNIWYRLASSHVNNPLDRVVNSHSEQVVSTGRKVVDLVSPPDSVLPLWSELFDLLGSRDRGIISNRQEDLVSVPITDFEILRVTTRRVLRWFIDTYQRSRVISCENRGRCNAVPEALIECQRADLTDASTLLWLLPDAETPRCSVSILEDIDMSRHWFIRNQWFETFSVTINEACLTTHYANCQLIRQDDRNLLLDLSS